MTRVTGWVTTLFHRRLAALVLVLWVVAGGSAARIAYCIESSPEDKLSEGWYLFLLAGKVFLILGFILVLIILTVVLLKRLMEARFTGGLHGGVIRLLGISYIAPKKAIGIVKVLNRVYIIGISESSMDTIGEIPLEEALKILPEDTGKASGISWKTIAKKWGIGKGT